MTIYRAFNEIEGFDAVGSYSDVIASTDSGVALAGINRNGVTMTVSASAYGNINIPDELATEGWMHFRMVGPTGNAAATITRLPVAHMMDELGNDLFGIQYYHASGARYMFADKWDMLVTSTISAAAANYDFNWLIHPTAGYYRIYRDNVLVYEFTGDTLTARGGTRVSKFRFRYRGSYASSSTGYYWHAAHFVLSDKPTFGARVHTLPVSGAGAQNDWDGVVANVSGFIPNEANPIYCDLVNETITFATPDLAALPDGTYINAVVLSVMARYADDAEVTKLIPVSYADGVVTQGLGGAKPVNNPGSASLNLIMERNPATNSLWTRTQVNDAEFGIRAKA